MKKALTIIGILLALVLVIFGVRFLLTSPLTIDTNISPDSITIDNKDYTNQKKVRLFIGKHEVILVKEGYKNIEKNISITPFTTNTLKGTFFQTDESIENAKVKTVSTDFIKVWFNYNNQADLNYLAKIKPFVTDEFYNTNYYMATSRPQDFQGQPALSTTLKLVEVASLNDGEATATAIINAKDSTGKETTINASIELVKLNNDWKVGYVKEI